MRLAILLAGAATILSAPTNALNLAKSDGAPKVVGLSTHKKPVSNPTKRDRIRRRETVTAKLDNQVRTLGLPGKLHCDANPVPGDLVFREWFVRHAATTDIDAPRYGEQRSLGEHTVVSTL